MTPFQIRRYGQRVHERTGLILAETNLDPITAELSANFQIASEMPGSEEIAAQLAGIGKMIIAGARSNRRLDLLEAIVGGLHTREGAV